jgi:DNA-binding NarL/FixJ family response regulator
MTGGEREAGAVWVVIADDHPVVRDGLRALLGSLGGVCVVGEAATGREAVRQAVTLRPDVLVLDLRMPDLDGVQATRQVVHDAPAVAVLVLTTFDDDDNLQDAVRAGARGYLLKGASQEEIARAIGVVAAGGAVFGASVASRVLGRVSTPPAPPPLPFPQLTPRERQILNLVATGLPNTSVAAALGLSAKTVGNHLSSVFAKLEVSSRHEAIVAARDAGLGRGAR